MKWTLKSNIFAAIKYYRVSHEHSRRPKCLPNRITRSGDPWDIVCMALEIAGHAGGCEIKRV